jgi:hypothetical protein
MFIGYPLLEELMGKQGSGVVLPQLPVNVNGRPRQKEGV